MNVSYAEVRSKRARTAIGPIGDASAPAAGIDPPEILWPLESSRSGLKEQTLNLLQASPDCRMTLPNERIQPNRNQLG